MAGAEQHKLREYLLDQLTGDEEEKVELRLLTEPDFAVEYDIVVSEITDDYIAGKFKGKELEKVEQYFFKSTPRRKKLKFALALKEHKSYLVAKRGRNQFFHGFLAIAASILLVGGVFYIWRALSGNSDLNKGLVALQSAFRDERPLEARISKFDYAPYVTTRGPEAGKVDQDELRRAELTLLDALKRNPLPAVHHGLGKVYLAKRDFDQAIEQFDQALKGDPKNAQLYNDLGVAWLEKGKLGLVGKEPAKEMEDLARGLENLNRALDLNSNLLETHFNRALCQEWMKSWNSSADAWRHYLEKDPSSQWSKEAREHLERVEQERNSKKS